MTDTDILLNNRLSEWKAPSFDHVDVSGICRKIIAAAKPESVFLFVFPTWKARVFTLFFLFLGAFASIGIDGIATVSQNRTAVSEEEEGTYPLLVTYQLTMMEDLNGQQSD